MLRAINLTQDTTHSIRTFFQVVKIQHKIIRIEIAVINLKQML